MVALTPEQARPLNLLLEDQLVLDEAFPTLQALRDNECVINGQLPEDAPVFPGKHVNLSPYYMNRSDPPKLGVWQITVEDNLQARLQTIPKLDNSDLVYNMTVKGEDNAVRAASQEETHQLATLIGILHKNCSLPAEKITQVTDNEKRHPFKHFGKLLLAKFKEIA